MMRRERRRLGKRGWLVLTLFSCGGGQAGLLDAGGVDAPSGDAAEGALDGGVPFDATSADAPTLFSSSDAAPPVRSCGVDTCPSGCCSADGVCITAPDEQNCGFEGLACTTCAPGDTCKGGACLRPQPNCGPSNCAGCCQGNDLCATGIDDVACGRNGGQCQRCVPSEGTGACVPEPGGGGQCGGYRTCHYPNCHGCCSSSTFCASGLSQNACGSEGETCHACTGGQQCAPAPTSGGMCVDAGAACNPQNCTGCCHGAICATGNQDVACGTGGAVCANCATYGWTCSAGQCG